MLETIKNWALSQGMTLVSLVLKAVIILVIGIFVVRIIMKMVSKLLEKSKLEKAAHGLICTLVRTVLYMLLLMILASSLGIDVTGVVALASVVTLAISLSLQDMLTNLIGGFTILYTHPFSSGDFVEIAGQSGTVKEIGMTYTKLATADNKLVFIPNKAVTSAEIINYSVIGTRRITIDVSASYDAPAQKVIDTLLEVANDPMILAEPAAPSANLSSYGDSVINYSLRFWVKSENYWDTLFKVNQNIKVAFDQNGIEMSYPHLNVHLDK